MVYSKILGNQKGFTLIELMTVLVILGVILGIGIPRYLQIQARAEWDADIRTLENIAKTAEVYAAQKNIVGTDSVSATISLNTLITAGVVDGDIVLNRKSDSSNNSVKNTGDEPETLSDYKESASFSINAEGRVTGLEAVITGIIGNDPYGTASEGD